MGYRIRVGFSVYTVEYTLEIKSYYKYWHPSCMGASPPAQPSSYISTKHRLVLLIYSEWHNITKSPHPYVVNRPVENANAFVTILSHAETCTPSLLDLTNRPKSALMLIWQELCLISHIPSTKIKSPRLDTTLIPSLIQRLFLGIHGILHGLFNGKK